MACGVMSRLAKWHVMFCPGWQSDMRCFVQGGRAACDVLSRVAKWHVKFCPGWQSGM